MSRRFAVLAVAASLGTTRASARCPSFRTYAHATSTIVYRIADCKKALLDVVNVHKYVQAQASAALKLIVSKCAHRRAQA